MAEPVFDVDVTLRAELRQRLQTEGYYQFPSILPLEAMARMRAGVTSLYEAGIPLGFCYIYDEFWYLSRWIDSILVAILGEGFRRLPDHWAWYVKPGSSGWGAHRDKTVGSLVADGLPGSLSIWVPLGDATPRNGCMYVVPADQDPMYDKPWSVNTIKDLATARALPAKAGSVLLWTQELLHWGGVSSRMASEPRISFSIEYQRGDVRPFNQPLMNPEATPPSFEQRLGLTGKQIIQYKHMWGPDSELLDLGRALWDAYPFMDLHEPGPSRSGPA
jgi:hypothetical protein